MKKNSLSLIAVCTLAAILSACHTDHKVKPNAADPNSGEVFSGAVTEVGSPLVSTFFLTTADVDIFNNTVPSLMSATFQSKFGTQLQTYNNGKFTTNVLGLSATQFAGVLSTGVLTVSTNGPTTYYGGTNIVTGRNLTDDVADITLKLIYGGPDGNANPGLTSDHVNHNDAAFLASFPYEAAPW